MSSGGLHVVAGCGRFVCMKTITKQIFVDEVVDVPTDAFPIYDSDLKALSKLRVQAMRVYDSDFGDDFTVVYELSCLFQHSSIWTVLMHYESEVSSQFPPNIQILDPIGSFMNILGVLLGGVREALDNV